MFEELLDHADDCCRSARRHWLVGAPGVDALDQSRFDPDIDVCCFPLHFRVPTSSCKSSNHRALRAKRQAAGWYVPGNEAGDHPQLDATAALPS
jgi:hypothetical protein